ncbi:MAG TPA: I78 family peptidase inhibitor [Pseudoxanthomonas sp.]|nr:I78 family peptidase inhibitor [Pseudoxanthomonas sp.]
MSRLVFFLAAFAGLALAGCAPAPDEQQRALDQAEHQARLAAEPPPPPPVAVDASACDPVQAKWLGGKKATQAELEQARSDAGARTVRTLKPGQVVTMEFDATRLNVELDEAGVVASVRCG